MKIYKLGLTALSLVVYLTAWSQDLNRSLVFREGDKLFESQQYVKAMRFYKEVLDQQPGHLGAMFQMGECYRLIFDYESALYYYEQVSGKDDSRFPLAKFHHADMLKHAGEFNRAVQGFEEFSDHLKNLGLHEDDRYRLYYKQAKIEKEGCLLALNDLTNPKPTHAFQLCGDEINTEYMDFAASTYGDEEYLCLTSSRSSGKGNLIDYRFGESFADIFRFRKEGDQWKSYSGPDKLEKFINTKWGDGSGNFNKEGTKFYYTNCNEKLGDICHIFVSRLEYGTWSEPQALGEAINIAGFDSRHPNLSPTGDTLFFSSNRPGGHGNYDIWMSVNAGGENWSLPQNLGDQINTPFFEISPFYDSRERALFFSSDGHRGYGGFDVYMAKGVSFFDPEIFNPGAPFNSNKDEVFMFIGKTKGYLSSNRDGGFGKLDIYEFDIETQEAIITEISADEAVAGRNSLFSDDYDFDSDEQDAIEEIISSFLAAKMVDVQMALTDELAEVYQNLSLDDRERINRIILARIRKLNEKDLRALRIEDEFYYRNLSSADKNHMDNLVTRYIEEDELALSVTLPVSTRNYYKGLASDDRERTDHIIAVRVKQAGAYEYRDNTYRSLPQPDQKKVDDLAYLYMEEKTGLDNLRMSPTLRYYLKELSDYKKQEVFASVKEKIMNLADDPKFDLREDDRLFYQNLNPDQLEALKEMASAFIVADIRNLHEEISVQSLKVYKLFSTTQQQTLNRILAKIISNTVKADIYFAEANLSEEEKRTVSSISANQIDAYVNGNRQYINEDKDRTRLRRFLNVSAPTWSPERSIFITEMPEEQLLAQTEPTDIPDPVLTSAAGNNDTGLAGSGGAGGFGALETKAGEDEPRKTKPVKSKSTAKVKANAKDQREPIAVEEVEDEPFRATVALEESQDALNSSSEEIRPVLEDEQKIVTLSSEDLAFYESLTIDRQKSLDRIIAMEYLNAAYKDPVLEAEDDGYYKTLTPAEKSYLKLLKSHLASSGSLPPAEASLLNEAFVFYNNLAPSLKSRWNRLVTREVLENRSGSYRLSPEDAGIRLRLSAEDKEHFEEIKNFRLANQRILTENFEVEAKDTPGNAVNFGVAKFNNSGYQRVSVAGQLIDNENGSPLAGFPLTVVNEQGEVIAKTTTGSNGQFDFEDLPQGDYKVVADKRSKQTFGERSFFVKDLKVSGSDEDTFAHTVKTNIYFDFDSDELRPEALATLQEIAKLDRQQKIYIELKSHTDNVGADDYNLNLSEQRNQAAMDKLRGLGVKGEDLEWLAMGHKSPIAPNNTAFGRQFNRRIEILVKSNEPIDYDPPKVYLVRPKGTLYSISKNFGISIEEIQNLNGLDHHGIEAFKPLRIPNLGIRPNLDMLVELNESVANSHNEYTVKPGETIITIAEKFNLPEELLIEMNDLQSHKVTPGQKLRIYVRER